MATKIDYAAVLADLEARRDALNVAIDAIKAIPQADGPAPKPKIGRPPKANSGPRPGDLDYEGPQSTSGAAHGKE